MRHRWLYGVGFLCDGVAIVGNGYAAWGYFKVLQAQSFDWSSLLGESTVPWDVSAALAVGMLGLALSWTSDRILDYVRVREQAQVERAVDWSYARRQAVRRGEGTAEELAALQQLDAYGIAREVDELSPEARRILLAADDDDASWRQQILKRELRAQQLRDVPSG